ncbi:MAG: 2-oxo acid dehydrogenase subunit E2 [Deltaproteobacteria bacterium]|nr:2-oxo acid dehydrogenase subunit E2 [Deltaproteobacteria bacterium]
MSFTKLKKTSPWRKLSLVTWKKPSDPTVYAWYEFDVTQALVFIENYNKKNNTKINLTHLTTKAIALTIAKYPALNGIIKWGNIYKRDSVDIFLQVAIEDKKDEQYESLSGAKICHADTKSLKDIYQELALQAEQIRAQKDPRFQKTFRLAALLPVWLLRPLVKIHEFAVYNLGINKPGLGLVPDPFGSAMLTSVGSLHTPPGFPPLVPPSRCPLLMCLGQVENKPRVVGDEIKIRPIAGITITFDHRFIDGLIGSKMVKTFMGILEHPEDHI